MSGTPARVVQYEAPDLGTDDVYGIWRIDDTDNSFYTQPFRIKYAGQDVLLLIMVSFKLSLSKFEVRNLIIKGEKSTGTLENFARSNNPNFLGQIADPLCEYCSVLLQG